MEYGTTIIGNAGRDAEKRTTQAGKDIWSTSIATYVGKESSTWVKIFTFDDNALKDIRKGDKVSAWGGLTLNEYTNKAGENKTTLELKTWECEIIPREPKLHAVPVEPEMAIDDSDIPGSDSSIPF